MFDLDGTLTDPRDGITRCIQHALRALGEPTPECSELERFIGPPLAETFAELLGDPGEERVGEAIRLYRERFADRGLFENRLIDGVPEMLGALARAGRTLYVVTSKPEPYARRIVRHFGLEDSMRAIHGSLLDGTRVHKHELIAYVMQVEGLRPERALMIGDREHDVKGARRVGVASLAVAWGFGTPSELTAAQPDGLVRTPDECLVWLGVEGTQRSPAPDSRTIGSPP
ncbi:MAG: HAD hydrolase-like protein [Myxococcota bacterium]